MAGEVEKTSTTDACDGATLGRELSTAVILFHEAIARRLGLGAADHKALDLILRSGPLTAGEIARQTGLTPGAVTGLVDRLEQAGYASRRSDPADRRRVLIAVVDDRPTDFTEIFAELGKEMSTFMGKYDDREVAAIIDYVSNTIEVLRSQTRELGKGASR